MLAYRLAKAAYTRLDGEGARLYGGRWNNEGVAMVYLSSSAALALVEYLVHLDPDMLPRDLMLLTLEIPDDIVMDTLAPLPGGWDHHPTPAACQTLGDDWIRSGRSAVTRVPSAIVPMEHNILLNPVHADSQRITIIKSEPFPIDSRFARTRKA